MLTNESADLSKFDTLLLLTTTLISGFHLWAREVQLPYPLGSSSSFRMVTSLPPYIIKGLILSPLPLPNHLSYFSVCTTTESPCLVCFLKVCVPRCDTVSRLKLGRTDFENHILHPDPSDESESKFISYNNKVSSTH